MNSSSLRGGTPAATSRFGFLSRRQSLDTNVKSSDTANNVDHDQDTLLGGGGGGGGGSAVATPPKAMTASSKSDGNDMLSVFHKKNPPKQSGSFQEELHSVSTECTHDLSVSDSPISVQTAPSSNDSKAAKSSTSTNSTPTSSTLSSSTDAVWRWHSNLVSQEATRRSTITRRMEWHQERYTALHQLVAVTAVHETKAACQWTLGLSRAQTQLASTFGKPLTIVNDSNTPASFVYTKEDDLVQRYMAIVRKVTDESSLPEKAHVPRPNLADPANIDLDDINSEWTTAGADDASVDFGNVPSDSSPALPTQSNNDGPSVLNISFPNSSTINEPYCIMHKQHVLLSETLVRQTISVAAKEKVQLLNDLCLENANTLEQVAGAILTDLQSKEKEIQKLWDVYLATAESMLATAKPKQGATAADQHESLSSSERTATPTKQTPRKMAAASSGATIGEVFVAEVAYRKAVAQQASNWESQLQTLQSMFEVAKEGECQRRAKLKRHLLVSVIQKHTAAFHHAQQLHTEALEECMRNFRGENEDNAKDMKDSKDKKKKKAAPRVVLTPRQRIEHVANESGSTVVWDDAAPLNNSDTTTDTVGLRSKSIDGEDDAGIKGALIDMDDFMDCSSDEDDDDLPLLAEAQDFKQAQTKDKVSNAPPTPTPKPHVDLKQNKKRKKKKAEPPKKANRVIMLDQESPDDSFFMDRLLYSGSLLESHFVEFAAVAKVEDERPVTSPPGTNMEHVNMNSSAHGGVKIELAQHDASQLPKTALVVVTKDNVMHLFDIDAIASVADDPVVNDASSTTAASPSKSIAAGSPPSNALQFLLKRLEAADLASKKQLQPEVSNQKEGQVSPSKMSFLRNTSSAGAGANVPVVKEKAKTFEFHQLEASFSIPVTECTFRFYTRGENAVKIGPKNLQATPYHGKLSFGSSKDQQAFVDATIERV